ncbi:MAG: Stf0 family sulfotransferase [Pseudomonadota bacterium]
MNTRFIIVGAARTGSTLLVRTLNSLPNIRCHGELLLPDNVRGYEDGFDPAKATADRRADRLNRLRQERDADPLGFIRNALQDPSGATGFKAIYSTLFHPTWSNLFDKLLADSGFKIVHLVRRDNLRRYVSEQVLQAGGPIHSAAGGRADRRVTLDIDIDAFAAHCQELEEETRRVRSLIEQLDTLELLYEDLAADTTGTVRCVCKFLSVAVDPTNIQPALSKVGASDLRDTINNYDALLQHPVTRPFLVSD